MKQIFTLFACALFSFPALSQSDAADKRKFADTANKIEQYKQLSQQASDNGNGPLARSYSDSVRYSILGSYIDSYTFKTIDNKQVVLNQLDKPVFIVASATWCKPCKAEIPALNKIIEEYADRVTFIALYQDTKDKMAGVKKEYNRQIAIVPSTRTGDPAHMLNISGFKHLVGFPTNYLINKDKQIVGLIQGATVATTYTMPDGEKVTIDKKQADEMNYNRLKEEMEALLENNN